MAFRFQNHRTVNVSAHGNGLHVGVNLEQRLDGLLAAHPFAHRQIQERHIKGSAKALRFSKHLDGFLPIVRHFRRMAHRFKRLRENFPHSLLVIHYQHSSMPKLARWHRYFLPTAQFPGRGKVDVKSGPTPHL